MCRCSHCAAVGAWAYRYAVRCAIHQPCDNIFGSAQCIEEGNELCYVSCTEPCLKFVVREIGTWLVHEW